MTDLLNIERNLERKLLVLSVCRPKIILGLSDGFRPRIDDRVRIFWSRFTAARDEILASKRPDLATLNCDKADGFSRYFLCLDADEDTRSAAQTIIGEILAIRIAKVDRIPRQLEYANVV